MSQFVVYHQGKKVQAERPITSMAHEEDIGLFESLRTYGGKKIFREEEHLKRFQETVRSIHYPFSISTAKIRQELHQALKSYQEEHPQNAKESLFIRLSVWEQQIYVMIGTRKHPHHLYEKGVNLQTSPVKRTHVNAASAQVKTSAYHNGFLARLEIKASETYEWIFLNAQGYITEVSIGNLFLVKKKQLITPPQDGILNGMTRGVVVECALRNRILVQEKLFTRHDVYNADEVFLTNTSWEILPVASLDGRKIGTHLPGPVTQQLQKTFKLIVKEENA